MAGGTDEGAADLIVAGAGLSAALLALRLSHLAAPPRILLVEAAPQPFGAKTWSFQGTDVSTADLDWLGPAVAARWPRQSVRFANLDRELETEYASLSSASMRAVVEGLGNVEIRTGAPIAEVHADRIVLEDGTVLAAPCVIDTRGHLPHAAMDLAYQKFVGWEVRTSAPHGVEAPVIMDASVPQIDGYRFVYLLPYGPDRILIEDTRYADGAALDEAGIEACIRDYAAQHGWEIAEVLHRESGVLPIALAYDGKRFWRGRGDVPVLGMRAGLFHATTGYSFPDAVRAANLVAEAWPISSADLAARIRDHAKRRGRVQAFYRLLNRMLFKAARPEGRHVVMEKFYRLPRPLIERFYAGRTTPFDMMRILSGKPPVPIHRAVRCMPEPAPTGEIS